jgi:hypothetical protein
LQWGTASVVPLGLVGLMLVVGFALGYLFAHWERQQFIWFWLDRINSVFFHGFQYQSNPMVPPVTVAPLSMLLLGWLSKRGRVTSF